MIITLLINSNEYLFAQVTPYMPADLRTGSSYFGNGKSSGIINIEEIKGGINGEISEATAEKQRKARISGKFKKAFKGYNNNLFEEIWEGIEKQVIVKKEELEKANSDREIEAKLGELYNKEVCVEIGKYYEKRTEEKVCGRYADIVEGLISGWLSEEENEWKVIKEGKALTEPIVLGLVSGEDIKKIKGFIWGSTKGVSDEIGGKEVKFKHGVDYYIDKCSVKEADYRSSDACEKGIEALELMVVSSIGNKSEGKELSDYVYEKLLKRSISDWHGVPYSSMMLVSGISLLSGLDSEYSYSKLEEFLTEYSIPSVVWGALDEYSGVVSMQGMYQMGEDIAAKASKKKAQRYLNTYNKRWQYIDEDLSKGLGVSEYYIKKDKLMFDGNKESAKNYYNIAYGNLLTDIGLFISKQGRRGKALSERIIEDYINNKKVHKPLVVGMIGGLGIEGKSGRAAILMSEGFYVDVNYGMSRYISKKLSKANASLGYNNIYSLDYYKVKDSVGDINFLTDSFIDVVMLGSLALSLPGMIARLPKLFTKLYRVAKIIRYGKFKTLIKVSNNIRKASGLATEGSKATGNVANETKASEAGSKAGVQGKGSKGSSSTKWEPEKLYGQDKGGNWLEYDLKTGEMKGAESLSPNKAQTLQAVAEGGHGGGSGSGGTWTNTVGEGKGTTIRKDGWVQFNDTHFTNGELLKEGKAYRIGKVGSKEQWLKVDLSTGAEEAVEGSVKVYPSELKEGKVIVMSTEEKLNPQTLRYVANGGSTGIQGMLDPIKGFVGDKAGEALGQVRASAGPKKAGTSGKEKFFKPINKKYADMTFKEKLQNRGFMMGLDGKIRLKTIGTGIKDIFKHPKYGAVMLGAFTAEEAPLIQARVATEAKAATEIVAKAPASSMAFTVSEVGSETANATKAAEAVSNLGKAGKVATPKILDMGRFGGVSILGTPGIITGYQPVVNVQDIPLQVYNSPQNIPQRSKGKKRDPIGYRLYSKFVNNVLAPSKRELHSVIRGLNNIPVVKKTKQHIKDFTNTFKVDKNASQFVQMQQQKVVDDTIKNLAATIALILAVSSLTGFISTPAAIMTTVALAPLGATQRIHSNPKGDEAPNDNSSNFRTRIFGNRNKAKNNLNLTQQELQQFVDSFLTFIAKDDMSKEALLNFLQEQGIQPVVNTQVEHGTAGNDYEKTYKDFIAAIMALDFTKSPEEIGKQFLFNTGLDKFKYGGQILIKKGTAMKDGTVKDDFQRINTLYISSKDFKLKDNESLVMDSYGNIYKLVTKKDGKQEKVYYPNVKAVTFNVPGLDMPIVMIGKTINKQLALNFLFMLMGFSSLGRFINTPIKHLWSDLPSALSVIFGTGIYATNILAIPFKPLVDKIGAKKMAALSIAEILVASILPTVFGMSGFNAINPTTTRLIAVITTSLLYGAAATGLQQVANTTADNMLGGKEAGYITSNGQFWKSAGSLSTYFFYAIAVGALSLEWPAMYWLMGIPAAIGAVLLAVSDLPFEKSKIDKLKERIANGDKTAEAELEALNKRLTPEEKAAELAMQEKIMEELKAKADAGDPDAKIALKTGRDFIFSWGGVTITLAIMMLCGSETLLSTVTRQLMEGWLGEMKFLSSDAIQTAITGSIIMIPALIGRKLATNLMKKYKDVPNYNQKMLIIAAAIAAGSALAMKIMGPSAGLLGLLFVIASNMTMSNFFTFAKNIMSQHNENNYGKRFSNWVGTLTTAGLMGCFLIPTIATGILGEDATAFDKLIVPMILIPSALAIMIPNMKHSNILDWNTPLKGEELASISQEIAKDIEETFNNISEEEKIQALHEIKTGIATELGITEEEVDNFLSTGILPNLSEENIKKLANFWGISTKDMKQLLKGKNEDVIIKKIQDKISKYLSDLNNDLNIDDAVIN